MGRPVGGRVQQDVPREVPQRRADVVEPVDDPQILVRRGEAPGDAPLPAVDEREREGPRRRRGPHGGQQQPPPQAGRHHGPVGDDQYGDGDRRRGARAHVGIPMGVHGRPVDVQGAVVVLDVSAHERGRRDQGGGGSGGEQVTACPGGGRCGAGASGGASSFTSGTLGARSAETVAPGGASPNRQIFLGRSAGCAQYGRNRSAGPAAHSLKEPHGRPLPHSPRSVAQPCAAPASPRFSASSCSSA